MKWNIFFKLKGGGGIAEVPNAGNPVEYVNLASLLAHLASNLPGNAWVEVVGVRVEAVEPEKGGES